MKRKTVLKRRRDNQKMNLSGLVSNELSGRREGRWESKKKLKGPGTMSVKQVPHYG